MKKYFLKLFKLIAIITLTVDLCLVGFGWPVAVFAFDGTIFDKAVAIFGTLLLLFLAPIADRVLDFLIKNEPDNKKH